jgi:P4 family phage/plasmid primase-like protien
MKNLDKAFTEAYTVIETIHGADISFQMLTFDREEGTNHAWPVENHYGALESQVARLPGYHTKKLEPFILVGMSDDEGYANKNILKTWGIALDFDNGLPDVLKNEIVKPSLTIETSPGRYQCVWILKQECSKEDYGRVVRCMAYRLGADMAHAKVSQLLRLPGFVHRRHGTVSRLMESTTRTFDLAFLEAAFDVWLVARTLQRDVPAFNHRLEIDKATNSLEEVLEDVKSALPHLKPYADDYMPWVSTMMAFLPLGDAGKALAQEFSMYSAKYKAEEFEQKWRSIQGCAGQVSTIFARAQQNGWKNPGFRSRNKEKALQVLTERDLSRLIAAELDGMFTALDTSTPNKQMYEVFAWESTRFVPVGSIAFRKAVEQAGEKVLNRLIQQGTIEKRTATELKHKLGTTRTLREFCDTAAEELVKGGASRLVRGFPYLGVANGVLNLISRELVPSRYQPITHRYAQVMHEQNEDSELFRSTLREIFEDDESMIGYFKRLCGYILLGNPKEQIFPILIGDGSNGKSVLSGVLQNILTSYATKLPTKAIMVQSTVNDGSSPSLAQLEDRRLAIVSEPNSKHTIDAGLIKELTGDRSFNSRGLYASNKDIQIEFVLMMLTNKLPVVNSDDAAFWRRIHIVPFNRKFMETEMDRDLGEKLNRQASGVLNIFLDGVQDYLLNGLMKPEKVMSATREKREDADPVDSFLKEMTVADESEELPLKALYDSYVEWLKENTRFSRATKQAFSLKLEEKGFIKDTRSNLVYFGGLRGA